MTLLEAAAQLRAKKVSSLELTTQSLERSKLLQPKLNAFLTFTEEEALATPQWRHHTRMKVIDVLAQTQELLREAREVFEVPDDDDSF